MALDIWWVSGSPYAWWVLLAAETKGLAYDGQPFQSPKISKQHISE